MSMKMRERGKKFFKMMANEVPQKKCFYGGGYRSGTVSLKKKQYMYVSIFISKADKKHKLVRTIKI